MNIYVNRIFFIFFIFIQFSFANLNPKNIFILANKNSQDSQKIASYYSHARKIPVENIICLDVPVEFEISRQDYIDKIVIPLARELNQKKSIFIAKKDDMYPFAFTSSVQYLILTKDIPTRIKSNKNINDDLEDKKSDQAKKDQLNTDVASVDSELAFCLRGKINFDGPLRNLSFNTSSTSAMDSLNILKIARLDGISVKDVIYIIDSSLKAEQMGIRGRVYIDKCKKFKIGDEWLDITAKELGDLGFDISIDDNPETIDFDRRLDGAIFYFGWYTYTPYSYFAHSNFKLSLGASALHIYSFSAKINKYSSWAYRLVGLGASATWGNVEEPFLLMTFRPDIYIKALKSGMSVGEASFIATPVLSWQNVYFGDPLYKPFAKNLDTQISDINDGRYLDEYSQYAIIRKMNIMILGKKDSSEVLEFGKKYLDKLPNTFALQWKIIEFTESIRDKISLAIFLGDSINVEDIQYTGLAMEIAKFLDDAEHHEDSLRIYNKFLRHNWKNIPFLKKILPIAIRVSALCDTNFAEEYQKRLDEINPPKDKKQ